MIFFLGVTVRFPAVLEGICSGTIIGEERGDGGFGYDPIFLPDGETLTFAQMPSEAKNQISHRGRALQAFSDAFDASWLDNDLTGDSA